MENNINNQTQTPTFDQMMALFAQTSAQFAETRALIEKNAKEAEKSKKELNKMLKELGKQIGGVHNTIGKLTESLFFQSLKKLLMKKFHVQLFEPNAYREAEDKTWIEIDALAVVNGNINSVFITEIKTKFSQDALKQLEANLLKFNKYYPELKDRKKFGILAVPHLTDAQITEILSHGFYPAIINDKIAKINAPDDYIGKEF